MRVFFEFSLFPHEPYKSLRYVTLSEVFNLILTSARLVSLGCLWSATKINGVNELVCVMKW